MGIGIISIFTEVASISSKLTVGILFNSFALIADAFHVMADFVLSTITYFSLKITSKPETIYYPHGHKLMESLIAFIMGIIILMAGFTLFLNTTGLNKFITLGGESGFNLHIHQNKIKMIIYMKMTMATHTITSTIKHTTTTKKTKKYTRNIFK